MHLFYGYICLQQSSLSAKTDAILLYHSPQPALPLQASSGPVRCPSS